MTLYKILETPSIFTVKYMAQISRLWNYISDIMRAWVCHSVMLTEFSVISATWALSWPGDLRSEIMLVKTELTCNDTRNRPGHSSHCTCDEVTPRHQVTPSQVDTDHGWEWRDPWDRGHYVTITSHYPALTPLMCPAAAQVWHSDLIWTTPLFSHLSSHDQCSPVHLSGLSSQWCSATRDHSIGLRNWKAIEAGWTCRYFFFTP